METSKELSEVLNKIGIVDENSSTAVDPSVFNQTDTVLGGDGQPIKTPFKPDGTLKAQPKAVPVTINGEPVDGPTLMINGKTYGAIKKLTTKDLQVISDKVRSIPNLLNKEMRIGSGDLANEFNDSQDNAAKFMFAASLLTNKFNTPIYLLTPHGDGDILHYQGDVANMTIDGHPDEERAAKVREKSEAAAAKGLNKEDKVEKLDPKDPNRDEGDPKEAEQRAVRDAQQKKEKDEKKNTSFGNKVVGGGEEVDKTIQSDVAPAKSETKQSAKGNQGK